MTCRLFILEEAEEIEKHAGTIANKFLQKLICDSAKLNLLFLAVIDASGDTIFNVEQLKEVKNELSILKNEYSIISDRNLETLLNAINLTIQEGQSTYLRISCK